MQFKSERWVTGFSTSHSSRSQLNPDTGQGKKLTIFIRPPEPALISQPMAGGQWGNAGMCLACTALGQTPGSRSIPPGKQSSWGWHRNGTDSGIAFGLFSTALARWQFSHTYTIVQSLLSLSILLWSSYMRTWVYQAHTEKFPPTKEGNFEQFKLGTNSAQPAW